MALAPAAACEIAGIDVTSRSAASRARGVARAMRHIEAHLCEPISAGELAAVACMSRFHFARVFRALVGISPMDYLRRRRIARAQALLREGRHSISQIACDLCFFDQSHFVRSFRHATGCTPARFAAQAGHAPTGNPVFLPLQERHP
ncbi:helix-turn-helix transcriptional regulator [Xanthomonas maliensis]|uniref:helix-turn-helix transcriptional regulator n=1 Tax=Xanthomonas maliensis TaxID=1321368 RepID=UPI00039A5118|nr:AraC family transcriptional regulator [Xanthomonas maliensis]